VIHSILKTPLNRAVRWKWIAVNPDLVHRAAADPRAGPVAAEPGAGGGDPGRGVQGPGLGNAGLVGVRRGELSALRWADLDLDRGLITVGRSIGQIDGRSWEKDTKTHQRRRISLDAATVQLLEDHRRRCAERTALGIGLNTDAYVFSLAPDNSTPLGLDTHFHALRHYSATELIAAGVDPPTVAGRLGHGGGGATTLRVYSAWVPESDRKAAETMGARMPVPPRSAPGR
jgi:integrase